MKNKTQKNYSNSVKKDDKFVVKIIEMLDEVNSNDWEKYTNFKMQLPKNLFTKKEYKGFNILTLAMDTMFRNFGTSFYASFNSISKAGGKLKKGAKGVMIEFFSYVYQDKETGKKYSEQQVKEMTSEELKKIFIVRAKKNTNAYKNFKIQLENYFTEDQFSNISIREDQNIINSMSQKSDIFNYKPTSNAAIDYQNLVIEFLNTINSRERSSL